MRGVSKRFRRTAALLALLTIVVAQGAVAAERGDRSVDLRDRFERAKRLVVTIFARLTLPPG
jgi:hypothetical protein